MRNKITCALWAIGVLAGRVSRQRGCSLCQRPQINPKPSRRQKPRLQSPLRRLSRPRQPHRRRQRQRQAIPAATDHSRSVGRSSRASHTGRRACNPGCSQRPTPKSDHPSPHRVGQGYRNRIIFTLSIIGVLAALVAAYIFGMERKAQPPVFKPVSSPYESAIYANGIIESDQPSGENINIFPEVSGPITKVLVHEGQQVSAGTPLFTIDDSVQRANTEQLRLQSEASLALLKELKAQPRKETLAIAEVAGGAGRIQPESGPRPVRQAPRLLRHRPEIDQQGRAGYRGGRRQSGGSRDWT